MMMMIMIIIIIIIIVEFYVHVTVHRNKFLYNKTNQMHQFPKFTPAWNSTSFGQFHPGPARKLSSNLYDIYQCREYSE